jgi:hypothetical protein
MAALLDVDPFCLLSFGSTPAQQGIETLLSWAQHGRWERFGFFQDFFGRQAHWPPAWIAVPYTGKKWHLAHLQHKPEVRANYYPAICLTGLRRHKELPQTYHFAYRNPGVFAGRWLQYGFVVQHGCDVRLLHINGQTDAYSEQELTQEARIETYFGPGPAEFQIASLHNFKLEHLPDKEADSAPAVRFQG